MTTLVLLPIIPKGPQPLQAALKRDPQLIKERDVYGRGPLGIALACKRSDVLNVLLQTKGALDELSPEVFRTIIDLGDPEFVFTICDALKRSRNFLLLASCASAAATKNRMDVFQRLLLGVSLPPQHELSVATLTILGARLTRETQIVNWLFDHCMPHFLPKYRLLSLFFISDAPKADRSGLLSRLAERNALPSIDDLPLGMPYHQLLRSFIVNFDHGSLQHFLDRWTLAVMDRLQRDWRLKAIEVWVQVALASPPTRVLDSWPLLESLSRGICYPQPMLQAWHARCHALARKELALMLSIESGEIPPDQLELAKIIVKIGLRCDADVASGIRGMLARGTFFFDRHFIRILAESSCDEALQVMLEDVPSKLLLETLEDPNFTHVDGVLAMDHVSHFMLYLLNTALGSGCYKVALKYLKRNINARRLLMVDLEPFPDLHKLAISDVRDGADSSGHWMGRLAMAFIQGINSSRPRMPTYSLGTHGIDTASTDITEPLSAYAALMGNQQLADFIKGAHRQRYAQFERLSSALLCSTRAVETLKQVAVKHPTFDLDSTDKNGDTILHLALEYGKGSGEGFVEAPCQHYDSEC